MYLLLPVLYFFIRAERRLWPLLVINVLAWVSVWSVTPWTSVSQTLGTTMPYFLPGAMAYVLSKRVTPVLPAWSFPVVLLLLCAVHSKYGSLPLSAPFCLAVGLMLPYFRQVTWRPLVAAPHTIAKYSYGLYLCHIPAIWFAFHHLRGQSLIVRVLAFLVSAGLPSAVLYHTVEQPAIRFGARLAARIAPGAPAQRPTPRTLEMEPAP